MFRRKDEDEIEYTLQPTSKNPITSGNSAATPAEPASVPFIKTTSAASTVAVAAQTPAQASAPVSPETLKADIPSFTQPAFTPKAEAPAAPAPKAEIPAPKEPAVKPAAPKSQAVNTFVPSALRAPASAQTNFTPASTPVAASTQTPNFATKAPLKIDNIGLETERRLTVGYGISLEGKVSDCDKLVIYGSVNAELNNVKALQISDSGCFRGAAEIDYAEISGLFEGELKVRKSIVINATGKVSGKITYGSIEIKPGGKFTGEIVEDKALSEAAAKSEDADKEETTSTNSSSNAGFNLFADDKEEIAA